MDVQTKDIRHIKTVPDKLNLSEEPLITSWTYWILWLLPVGAVAIDLAWQRRKRFRTANPKLVRRSLAKKNAFDILDQAKNGKMDPYGAIEQALTNYLHDRFDQPVTGMTQSELSVFLAEKGVPPTLVKQVRDALNFSQILN